MNAIIKQSAANTHIGQSSRGAVTKLMAFAVSVLFSVAVTAALILLMHSLIYKEYIEPESPTHTMPANIWAEKQIIETQKEYEKPEKQEIQETPPVDSPEIVLPNENDFTGLLPGKFNVDPGNDSPIEIGQSGMLVKRVAAAPRYPNRALTRGVEGFVDVRFDVTAIGNTENIRVLQAQPQGVFEKAATAAVAKYKYQPAIQDGEPVATPNVTERIRFSIEK
ncbi:MAG: TonB family protein [Cellvibrionaceae bacterium]|nr:TonB family protein [Cellvibrionaceae bacterium]